MPGLSLSRLSMDPTRASLPVERLVWECVALNPGRKMWESQFGLQVKRVLLLPSPVVPSATFCFLHLHTWEQNITVATPPSATNMKFQSYNLEEDWNTDRRGKKNQLKCEFCQTVAWWEDEELHLSCRAGKQRWQVKSIHVRLFILYLNSLNWFCLLQVLRWWKTEEAVTETERTSSSTYLRSYCSSATLGKARDSAWLKKKERIGGFKALVT